MLKIVAFATLVACGTERPLAGSYGLMFPDPVPSGPLVYDCFGTHLTIGADNTIAVSGYDVLTNAHVDGVRDEETGTPNVTFDTHYQVEIGEGGVIDAHWELWIDGDGGTGHATLSAGASGTCSIIVTP